MLRVCWKDCWRIAGAAARCGKTNVGGYQDFTVSGRSGFSGTVTVWFPPSYTTAAAAHREWLGSYITRKIRPDRYAL